MKTSVEFERKHAFVLGISHTKKMWDLSQNYIGNPKINVRCRNGLKREFDSWEQFLSFDNPPQKEILSLSLISHSKECEKLARVEFNNNSWRPISINAEGKEDTVVKFYEDISDVVDGIKPWYSKITNIDFFHFLWFLIVILNLIVTFGINKNSHIKLNAFLEMNAFQINLIGIAILVFSGLLILLSTMFNKLKLRFFPVGFFALGQGEQRYRIDEKVRWSIAISFFVSAFASLIVSFFV